MSIITDSAENAAASRGFFGRLKAWPSGVIGHIAGWPAKVLVSSVAVVFALTVAAAVSVAVLAVRMNNVHSVETSSLAAMDSAKKRIPLVLSYDFNTIDTEFRKRADNLTGTFKNDFAELGNAVIIPAAHKDSITTEAAVAEAAVVKADENEVTVLMFLNQTTKSATMPGPRLDGSRVRVTMTESGDQWLISDITPV
ncbi:MULTISPECIES: hypothetical protein [Nocardia]|jgi:Mce-associated membrane protein|nr:hypothetical protein [Nocardia mangyaensis]